MNGNLKRADVEDSDIELLDRDDPLQRMPFLGSSKIVHKSVRSRFYNLGRHFRKIGVFVVFLIVLVFVFDTWGDKFLDWIHADFDDALTPDKDQGQPLHVLIPATAKDVNLCKTTLGLNILGYPDPTFIGWEKTYDNTDMVDGGARIGSKITQALAYIETLKNDTDLVLMADGYDTWFQLPVSTLRNRYFRTLDAANYRMRLRLGRRAIRREALKDHVVFAAGKTCTPNGLHTVACYPVIEPPTKRGMYGPNTDTSVGRTKHSSYRPRYLDAGFMMGRVKDVRQILQRAQELVEQGGGTEQFDTPYSSDKEGVKTDTGPGRSASFYHGDPQSIFSRIYGEQEFQREVIRLRYRSWFKKWSLQHTPGFLEGQHFDDTIKPPFPHEKMKKMKGHPMEYGIALDYVGMIGSSTANSEHDFRALVFDESWDRSSIPDRTPMDCRPRIKSVLPGDVAQAPLPKAVSIDTGPSSWADAHKFWANMCLDNIPVMLHHNGDKELREKWWSDVWYQKHGRQMLQNLDESNPDGIDATQGRKPGLGAWTQDGAWLGWRHMCPSEYDMTIFGESFD